MKSNKPTSLLLLVLLFVFTNAYFQFQKSRFQITACKEECENLLDPTSQIEVDSEQIQLLISEIISGNITFRAFVQRLGHSHPRIVYTIINNHRFFAQNILYANFFRFRYQVQLQMALNQNGLKSCPRVSSSTFYPKFSSKRTGIPAYKNISDQINYRPPAYSQTDGFWAYSHKLSKADLSTLSEADKRYGFASMLGIAQQAYCFIELYKTFDASTRTIIFPPSENEVNPSFYQHWAHLDSSQQLKTILEAARKEIAEWLPKLSRPDLYNYVSILSFIAFQTGIIEIVETCKSGDIDDYCDMNGNNLSQQP